MWFIIDNFVVSVHFKVIASHKRVIESIKTNSIPTISDCQGDNDIVIFYWGKILIIIKTYLYIKSLIIFMLSTNLVLMVNIAATKDKQYIFIYIDFT